MIIRSSRARACSSVRLSGPMATRASALRPVRAAASNFEEYVVALQRKIIDEAEALDAELGGRTTFLVDRWQRDKADPNAGYGITAVLEGGSVLEKAASNVSVIRGTLSAARAAAMSSRGRHGIDDSGGQPYAAAAMSLVFHSAHPFVPTLRADVRVFEVEGQSWFGGGCDLTPNYLTAHVDGAPPTSLRPDIDAFHARWRAVCDDFGVDLYTQYKQWCDDYFYIPCRQEHRGTGGIFFDDLDALPECSQGPAAFVRAVGDSILPSWAPIARARGVLPFDERHRDWQELRRGRYVEFNLLYDRGVKFGLDGGRMESIMVSAPPRVRWAYQRSVAPPHGSPEAEMLDVLRRPRPWGRGDSA